MAQFEDNSFTINIEEPEVPYEQASRKKDETNSSNNSSARKKGEKSSKPAKGKRALKQGAHGQTAKRNVILDKLQTDGYAYDGHTQAFLNYLTRTNPEGRNVKSKVFKNQLLLAENMDDIPTSFAKNWLMVVCPVGSRCLVVASMGHTGAYSKTGFHIISHPSNLPMGNKTVQGYGSCVLDCIYCNETETYFVLDIMCWDGQALYDCEAQVRFRQLQDRIREYDLGRPSRQNPYPFVPLKTFTPTKSNICGAVRTAPYMIDGLLFYHKQTPYTPGTSPLVLWLTLDRLPTKMKIEIPEMGIVTAVSYKDPVALALAHGVSPAIISQVYPGNSLQGHARSPQGSRYSAQGRPFQGYSTLPAASQGFYGGQQMRRDLEPLYSNDDFAYLSEMMMNLSVGPGSQGAYGQYDHPLLSSGAPFFSKFNSNNNAMSFYGRDDGGRDLFQFQAPMSDKKKKQQQARNDDQKLQNWFEPHSAMKSQWMIERPENFEEDFLTCVTPVAKRRIIVAALGRTCTYNKYGKLIDMFTSSLPNGSLSSMSGANDLVILDAFWCNSTQKFYVFDVMHWRQQPFYDAEAEFRFFWLADKISNVTLKKPKKEIPLEVLPMVQSDQEGITAALKNAEYRIDGLLSYQKKSKYVLSATPLALWLKVDMMEELLGYPQPEDIKFKPSTEKERKQRLHFVNQRAQAEKPVVVETSDIKEEREEVEEEEEGDDDSTNIEQFAKLDQFLI